MFAKQCAVLRRQCQREIFILEHFRPHILSDVRCPTEHTAQGISHGQQGSPSDELPDTGYCYQKTFISRMERRQAESICTIIFAHSVGNVDELPVNASSEIQREDGVEGHRIYDIRCLVDRLCKDLVADQM